jgi:hypothetical protein
MAAKKKLHSWRAGTACWKAWFMAMTQLDCPEPLLNDTPPTRTLPPFSSSPPRPAPSNPLSGILSLFKSPESIVCPNTLARNGLVCSCITVSSDCPRPRVGPHPRLGPDRLAP